MPQAVIELVTFRFVAQHLNHCAIAVPDTVVYQVKCRARNDKLLLKCFMLVFLSYCHITAVCEIRNLGTVWKINLDHIVIVHDNNSACRGLI